MQKFNNFVLTKVIKSFSGFKHFKFLKLLLAILSKTKRFYNYELILTTMETKTKESKDQREKLSIIILIGSLAVIVAVGAVAIVIDAKNNALMIFNMLLPMVATWVGTILAFYFGRENFESASKQMQNMATKFSKNPKSEALITAVMKPFDEMVFYTLDSGTKEENVKIKELQDKLNSYDKANRIPIADENKIVKYMIHESSIDKYLAIGNKNTDSLKQLLDWWQEKHSVDFISGKAFIIATEKNTLTEIYEKMDELPYCKDVFVTRGGTPLEPSIGWVSNLVLLKFLEL